MYRGMYVSRGGSGHLLLLAGEAGIGKTRLLHALQEQAKVEGFALWAAGAFPQDVELSAGLLLELGHAMSRSDRADVAARGQALVAGLADVTEPPADSGDAHRCRRLLVLDAVERLASLTDDGPALLALEDLHWCDELSLEIVVHLARRLRSLPLFVVGTLRTDELHQNAPVRSWRSRLLLQRMGEEARLSRLDLEQTGRMVRELSPGKVNRSVWSSSCISGPAVCRCTSRSWSTPPRKATCPRIRRTCRRPWRRRSTSGSTPCRPPPRTSRSPPPS